MPKTLKTSLIEVFPKINPTIYYSIYSVEEEFRYKWLPAAMPIAEALKQLKEYQKATNKLITFHCSFIKGENDKPAQIRLMMDYIKSLRLLGNFNIVHYNPYSTIQGDETPNYDIIMDVIERYMPVRLISRVGIDNYCSCGMFVN